jgi:hypothetical protein
MPVGSLLINTKGMVPVNSLVGYVVVHSRSPIKVRAYLAEDLLVGQNVNIYADLFMDELLGIENQTKYYLQYIT